MASTAASTRRLPASFAPVPAGARRPRLRQLWQVPVFLLGLAALVAVFLTRPPGPHSETDAVQEDLTQARRLLARADGNYGEAAHLLQQVLGRTNDTSSRAGEAHFLLGSAYLLLAEKDKAPSSDKLREALEQFNQAESRGVPGGDRVQLSFRLGKVLYLLNDNPERVVELLSQCLPQLTDNLQKAEGYSMLSRAYLRLPKPDTRAALEATRAQLQLPIVDDRVMAPARLLQGELLLREQDREKACAVLERIKSSASPELAAAGTLPARAATRKRRSGKRQRGSGKKHWPIPTRRQRNPPLSAIGSACAMPSWAGRRMPSGTGRTAACGRQVAMKGQQQRWGWPSCAFPRANPLPHWLLSSRRCVMSRSRPPGATV